MGWHTSWIASPLADSAPSLYTTSFPIHSTLVLRIFRASPGARLKNSSLESIKMRT